MSAQIHGVSGLNFGLVPEDGIIIQNLRIVENSNEATVVDEDGDIVGVAYHGFNNEISFTYVFKDNSGVDAADIGAAISLNAANYSPSGKLILTQRTRNKSNTGFQTVDVTAKEFPLITP